MVDTDATDTAADAPDADTTDADASDTNTTDTDADTTDPEQTVRRYYELVDRQAYDELVSLFAPDVTYERPGQSSLDGREALHRFYTDERPLSEGSHTLHAVVPDGATIAVRGTFTGTQDGERVSFGFADFHEFEDGQIARRYTFTDRDEV